MRRPPQRGVRTAESPRNHDDARENEQPHRWSGEARANPENALVPPLKGTGEGGTAAENCYMCLHRRREKTVRCWTGQKQRLKTHECFKTLSEVSERGEDDDVARKRGGGPTSPQVRQRRR